MTNEQYNNLRPWEQNFLTAVKSDWARHPGSAAIREMLDIYNDVTGQTRRVNASCQNCVLAFLKDLGTLYFQHKEKTATKKTTRTTKKKTK